MLAGMLGCRGKGRDTPGLVNDTSNIAKAHPDSSITFQVRRRSLYFIDTDTAQAEYKKCP